MFSIFVSLATALGFANAVRACMLASFTYDPCTSAISGTLIDNGIEIGSISPTINYRDSIGTAIQLAPSFSSSSGNIRAYVHTIESISSTTSASTSGKKQGYLSHITFHTPSGEVTHAFELVREAKNQQWSNAVYGCDDPVGDAWFYELGGWSRWGGQSHPVSKAEGGKLRCDSEALMYDGNQVATEIELAPPARRRATGAARRQEAQQTATPATVMPAPISTFETPIVQVDRPAGTTIAKGEASQQAAQELTKLRSGQETGGAGGVREGVKPNFNKPRFEESKAPLRSEERRQIFGSTGTLRSSELRPEDLAFRKRDANGEAEGLEKRRIFGPTETLRSSGVKMAETIGVANRLEARVGNSHVYGRDEGLGAAWRDMKNEEALKALVQKAAQAASGGKTKREEAEITSGLGGFGNQNRFDKVERRATQTTSW